MYLSATQQVTGQFSMALYEYTTDSTTGNANAPGKLLVSTAQKTTIDPIACEFMYLWDVSDEF